MRNEGEGGFRRERSPSDFLKLYEAWEVRKEGGYEKRKDGNEVGHTLGTRQIGRGKR